MININNIKFTEAFEKLVNILTKKLNLSLDEYAKSLKDEKQYKKIKFCELINKYLINGDNDFFNVSQKMIDFINSLIISIDDSERTVKTIMRPIKDAILEDELLIIAADRLSKTNNNIMPVFNSRDFAVGVVSCSGIVKYIASGSFSKSKKVSSVTEPHKFQFISEDTTLNKIQSLIHSDNQIYLVLNNSKKVVGWLI